MSDVNDPISIELDLTWQVEHVPAGRVYEDEPTVTVTPGWWIRGINPAGNAEAEMHVPPVYNIRDEDVTEQLARRLADRMNEERTK